MRNSILLSTLVSTVAAASLAAQNTFPLPASSSSTTSTENTAPFTIPTRMTQARITNRNTLVANGLTNTLNNWDMIEFSPDSRYIFVPCENFGGGGGLFRYDTLTGEHVEIMTGNGTGVGNRNPNPATFNHLTDETAANDPCSWTPHGTIIFGEETTGGRFFEVMDPLNPTGPFNVVWHGASIPAVSHEGMRFDSEGSMYFIDESNSGSIYKFVPDTVGDLSAGSVYVLSIDAYATNPNAVPIENFNSTANRLTTRVGPATWVRMTGPNNLVLTTTNPFTYVTTTAGRDAADELFGTPFGRPEDLDIGVLANGRDVVYVALTSENRVISIELIDVDTCIVRDFANYDTINLATGMDVNPLQQDPFTSPGGGTVLNNPDNIEIDAWGSVYIIEDSNPGDIWKAVDANNDGVAEAVGLFVTLGVGGSEPTGMNFDQNDPYRFIVSVQHPSSGNDALWSITTRPYPGSEQDLDLLSGVDTLPRSGPGEFVRSAPGFSTVGLKVDSPSGSHWGSPFALLFQAVNTSVGQPAFLPPLWMSPFAPSFLLLGGSAGQFPIVLPPGGASIGIIVPPGLLGLSIVLQGVTVSQSSTLVLTDAVEMILK